MARELVTGADGKVTAVSYVEKATRTEKQIRCRAVVVAASACESARLLLNSKSPRFPNGLANDSGMVGRNLTDTTGYDLSGYIPALARPAAAQLGRHRRHARLRAVVAAGRQEEGFSARLSHRNRRRLRYAGARQFPRRREGYGRALKSKIREEYGAWVGFSGRGEMIPNASSYCEIDPANGRPVGHPRAALPFPLDRRTKSTRCATCTIRSRPSSKRWAANAENKPLPARGADAMSIGGEIIHEAGTVRMSDDPKQGPLNRWCQAHDVKNLFVADAAPFLGNPDKNVTLTIVALAWRTAEYLAEEMRKGNV